MKSSYKKFCTELSLANFDSINDKVKKLGKKPLKIENFQLEEYNHNPQKLKKSPYLNTNKEPFDNEQNLYLRVISLIKQYLRVSVNQNQINFLQFVEKQSNLQHLLNKLQNLRIHSLELQLIFYLFKTNNRKLLNLYIKLRDEILKRCNLDTTKFNPISIHNPHKHFIKQNIRLNNVKIDYQYWSLLIENVAKVQVEEDMLWWASKGDRMINAEEFVRICLWKMIDNQRNN